jgi:uncharacterized membrane protein YdjX (TVP38/TMEM64 family)
METDNAVGPIASADRPGSRRVPKWLRVVLVFAAIAAALGIVLALDLDGYLTLDALAANRAWLLDRVADNAAVVVIAFIAVYAATVALSVPGAAVLTVAGGFLFGTVFGAIYAVIGATLGAVGIFLFVKAGLGDALTTRAGSAVDRLRTGFQDNAFGYLLFLRLLPVFPFFVVNLAAAILDVPLRTFTLATLIGIIPGSLIYASIGDGLGFVIDEKTEASLGAVFTPEVFLPLAGLALLSLAPIVYKAIKHRRAARSP